MSPDAPKASYQDVDLILRLYEMRRTNQRNSGFLSRFLSRPPKADKAE